MDSTTSNEGSSGVRGIHATNAVAPAKTVTSDQVERLARLRAQRNGQPPVKSRTTTPARPRKQHPAGGARTLALVASAAATAGVAGAMAYADAAESSSIVLEAQAAAPAAQAVPTTEPVELPTTTTEPTPTEAAVAAAPVAAEPVSAAEPEPATAPVAAAEPEATSLPIEESTAPIDAVAASSGFGDGTFVGTAEYTEWGNVQVQVTISDGRLVDIVSPQMPSSRKSSQINNAAEPILEAQATATQSADLDIVSGATFTSITYEDSLQAALDQAALAAQGDVAVEQ